MDEKEFDMVDDVMLPGFRFHPTDEELVTFYLKNKIEQRPLPFELIKQVDIYKHDPWDLPSKILSCPNFFTSSFCFLLQYLDISCFLQLLFRWIIFSQQSIHRKKQVVLSELLFVTSIHFSWHCINSQTNTRSNICWGKGMVLLLSQRPQIQKQCTSRPCHWGWLLESNRHRQTNIFFKQ